MVLFLKGFPVLYVLRLFHGLPYVWNFPDLYCPADFYLCSSSSCPRRVVLNLVSMDFQGVLWGLGTWVGGNDIFLLASS